MIDESKQELLVQYLLNEVDPSTAAEIRAELEGNVELRDFVREAEDALASMAYLAAPIQPPAGIAQRVLQLERTVSRAGTPRPGPATVWLVVPWALAACLAIACVILGMERTLLQKRLEQIGHEFLALQQRNARVEGELGMLQQKNVLAEIKIATLKAQVAAYEAATAVVVWDKNQKTGVIQLDKLPPPEPGKDYQLWVIDPKTPQPVSAGVLAVRNNGLIRASFRPEGPIESAAAFAISVERAGGAPKPEGQIILVGK